MALHPPNGNYNRYEKKRINDKIVFPNIQQNQFAPKFGYRQLLPRSNFKKIILFLFFNPNQFFAGDVTCQVIMRT